MSNNRKPTNLYLKFVSAMNATAQDRGERPGGEENGHTPTFRASGHPITGRSTPSRAAWSQEMTPAEIQGMGTAGVPLDRSFET